MACTCEQMTSCVHSSESERASERERCLSLLPVGVLENLFGVMQLSSCRTRISTNENRKSSQALCGLALYPAGSASQFETLVWLRLCATVTLPALVVLDTPLLPAQLICYHSGFLYYYMEIVFKPWFSNAGYTRG